MEAEESALFPRVETELGDARLAELGKRMKARFDEVMEAGFSASVPRGYAKTSADRVPRSGKVRRTSVTA